MEDDVQISDTSFALSNPSISCEVDMREINFLLVDDEIFNLIVLKELCQQAFYNSTIFEAKDGAEAINIIMKQDRKNKPINLVFMDCMMPVKDGFQASREIFQLY